MPYHDPLTHYAVTTAYGLSVAAPDPTIGMTLDQKIAHHEAELSQFIAFAATIDASDLDGKAGAIAGIEAGRNRIDALKSEKKLLQPNNSPNPYKKAAFYLLGAGAAAVSYSRSQSLLRAFGASIVSVPYLIYVAIETRKEKK